MTTTQLPDAFGVVGAARTQRDVLTASGPDTISFLQGQLSQDLDAIEIGGSAWSLLLSPQGKVESWLRVTRTGEQSLLLDTDVGSGEATLTRLNRFKLRTNCDLALQTWDCLSVRGANTEAVAAARAAVPGSETAPDMVAVDAEWPGVAGFDVLAPQIDPAMGDQLGVGAASADDLLALRILSGVPAMDAELTEGAIAAEVGIVERSVSFTKGCYTGQELVARIDSRGNNVAKRLVGVTATSTTANLEPGQVLSIDDAEVGTITSAHGPVALAYLKRSVDTLPATATAGEDDVSMHLLPLV